MSKKLWDRRILETSTTRDIIECNPSGDYTPNFIPQEVIDKYRMPKRRKKNNG